MTKKVFRYFISLDKLEKWLNSMSANGWRLMKTDLFTYTFEQSKPSNYIYRTEFVGDKTKKELDDYKQFLRQNQTAFFTKGRNLGKLSFGSIRWRPYGRKWGVIATSPGTMNSEILIIEQENHES
ncbi:DUF2812 domain-containing protein [Paenibacillus fonticola]|uniref:DUF2812 domain-containing protein n=1 Tax=Paenibacillus fonticola TaxID=379896 RepID=UPI00036E2C5D|nr:DUF2812 domain-containing protein [Paenibacillus fonticola]